MERSDGESDDKIPVTSRILIRTLGLKSLSAIILRTKLSTTPNIEILLRNPMFSSLEGQSVHGGSGLTSEKSEKSGRKISIPQNLMTLLNFPNYNIGDHCHQPKERQPKDIETATALQGDVEQPEIIDALTRDMEGDVVDTD